MRRVAVINQKGGVGKTTTAVNHGAALARLGRRVLLIDLDPQANLTIHVDCRPEPSTPTATDVLLQDINLVDVVRDTETANLQIVPADTSLASVEQVLADRIGREMILREKLNRLAHQKHFDFVLMDCPPSLGVLSANALVAAHEVLIPMQTEYFALQGMAKLLEVVELVRDRLNPKLEVSWVLPCMVDLRTNLTAEVLEEIRKHFGDVVAETVIRSNVKLAEAPSFGRTIFEHAPGSNGAEDHFAFAREFLARSGRALGQAGSS
ncbi:MAG: AAA family ATPase [Planctomycetota bacterium]